MIIYNINLDEDCTWQKVVLINKGVSGYFRGIGMVGVLWKTVTRILNYGLTTDIKLHNVMNRLREGQGMGT